MVTHPVLRQRHRPCRADLRVGHHHRHSARKSQNRRRLARNHVDSVRGHRPESFRNDGGRRGPALRAGIRADSVRLLDRSAGRTGIFRIVQTRRHDAGHVRRGDRIAGRGDGLCRPSGDRHADSDDGRHPFGRRDQHPRTGRRTAGLRRCVGDRRPHDRAGLRRGLSARRRGHHIHDDLHPLRPAREVRKGGRGAGGAEPGAQARRQGVGRIPQQDARRPHGGLCPRPDQPSVRHIAHPASRRNDLDGRCG